MKNGHFGFGPANTDQQGHPLYMLYACCPKVFYVYRCSTRRIVIHPRMCIQVSSGQVIYWKMELI